MSPDPPRSTAAARRAGAAVEIDRDSTTQAVSLALLALPKAARTGPILVWADSAGATHCFVDELHRRGLAFSIGFTMEPAVKQAILAAPADGWLPARDQDDHDRRGAWVCELAGLDLAGRQVRGRSAAANGPTRAPSRR